MSGQPKNFTTVMIKNETHEQLDNLRGEKSYHEFIKRLIGEHKQRTEFPEAEYFCHKCFMPFKQVGEDINENRCPRCGSKSYENLEIDVK